MILIKSVEWRISIYELESGSVKEISGFSNIIDSNYVSWNGNTSQVPFFKKELCAVELAFLNEVDL